MRDGRPTVALLIPTLENGGAERQIVALKNGLSPELFRTFLITLHDPRAWRQHEEGKDVAGVVAMGGEQPVARLWSLIRFLKGEQVQLLHSFLDSGNAYAAVAQRFVPDLRIILGIRASHVNSGGGLKGRIMRRIAQWACGRRLAVCNSEAGRRELLRRVPDSNTTVIPNGIDTTRFAPDPAARTRVRQQLGVTEADLVVGTVANFSPYKDYPSLIQAAAHVNAEFARPVHFAAIGDNRTESGEQARRFIAEQGLAQNFHLMGPSNHVERWIPGFDLYCSSSLTEGSSNAIAEAMACGVPCVVTDVGDSAALVSDTGIASPARDPAALASAILKMLRLQPAGRQAMGREARARIQSQFSVAQMVSAHSALYGQALGI